MCGTTASIYVEDIALCVIGQVMCDEGAGSRFHLVLVVRFYILFRFPCIFVDAYDRLDV